MTRDEYGRVMRPPGHRCLRPRGNADFMVVQNSHRPTQTQTDINYTKDFTVCVCLCVSVANHIKEWGMFRLGILDLGLRI